MFSTDGAHIYKYKASNKNNDYLPISEFMLIEFAIFKELKPIKCDNG